jgi:hypothetical protein
MIGNIFKDSDHIGRPSTRDDAAIAIREASVNTWARRQRLRAEREGAPCGTTNPCGKAARPSPWPGRHQAVAHPFDRQRRVRNQKLKGRTFALKARSALCDFHTTI